MTLLDVLALIYIKGTRVLAEHALVGTESHRTTHVGDVLLLLHDVDDVVVGLLVHLTAVGVGIAQDVAGKLDDHHLHAETDAEGGYVVRAGIVGSDNLSLDATLSESGTDHDAVLPLEHLFDVLFRYLLRVDESEHRLVVVVRAGLRETLADALVGILQVVLSDESDLHLLRGLLPAVEEILPRSQCRTLANFHSELLQDGLVQSLVLHVDGHLVDAGQVFALYDAVLLDVAEACHLLQDVLAQMLLCPEHEDVGLNTHALQLLHGVLRRFRLQFAGSLQVRHVGEVNTDGVAAHLPLHLADGLHERGTLDVADRAAYLGDDEVVVVFLSEQLDVALDLVGDVWHHLDGLAQIVAAALLVDDSLIDTPSGERVGLRRLNAGEALVVAQVEVGLHTVDGDIAFAMFVGVERTGVDVDVGVELLDGDVVAPGLQELAD